MSDKDINEDLEELAEKVNDEEYIDVEDENESEDFENENESDNTDEESEIIEDNNEENETQDSEEEISSDEIKESENETIEDNIQVEEKETNEEIIDNKEEKKKDKRKTIIIIFEAVVVLALAGIIIYYLIIMKNEKNNKNNEITEPTTQEIKRPSSDLEYLALKQSSFGLTCDRTKDGDKIKTLRKGMIIECRLEFETSQRVSELYFDLSASKNLKFSSFTNQSSYTVDTDLKTFKLTTYEPTPVMTGGINFYYEVTDEEEKTGYIETKDIVFKDDSNQYYKVLNNLTTFPVEYNDKIYIYKAKYDEEDEDYFYFSSKSTRETLEEDNAELVDTFQCENDSCEAVSEYSNYFLINDNKLLIYDLSKKTTRKIKVSDDIVLTDYSYELIISHDKKVNGIIFRKDYVDKYVCDSNDVCYEDGISGYNVGYYSLNTDSFTIALDYGFVGSSEFSDYDVAMIVQKDGKIGVFSYEEDNMILDLSNEYYSAFYDESLNAIGLEVKDNDNNIYYYKYFDLDTKSFKLNTKRLDKFENANVFYTTHYNKNSFNLAMLFNSKGEPLKNLPYIVYSNLYEVSDRIITYSDSYYKLYDLNGNFLYGSSYPRDKIVYYNDLLVVVDVDQKYGIENGINSYIEICDNTETNSFSSIKTDEENNIIEVYIKDSSVTEEGMNGYKYTLKYDEQTNKIINTHEPVFIK